MTNDGHSERYSSLRQRQPIGGPASTQGVRSRCQKDSKCRAESSHRNPHGDRAASLELESKFSDVGFSSIESDLNEPIENLDLGPTSGIWLREVGITTISELERLGPTLAHRLVKAKQPKASLNLLWAMAAGLKDCDWRELTDQEKEKWWGRS